MSDNAFELSRGDDATITISISGEDNLPINLTGYKIFFTAKKHLTDSDDDAVLIKEINGNSEGIVDVNFKADETTLLRPRSYWWDVQLEKDGVVTSTIRQLFKIIADVTRRVNTDLS